jgi:hypothetical protein
MHKLYIGYIQVIEKLKAPLMMADKIKDAEKVEDEIKKVRLMDAELRRSLPSAQKTNLMRGLVLYYDFNKNERDKVTDRSGNGNHGANKGATWKRFCDGRKGVMEFDGKDDWIDCKKALLPTADDWTIALWVVVPKASQTTGGHIIEQYIKKHKNRFCLFVDKSNLKISAGNFWPIVSSVSDNKWVYIVLSKNDSGFRFFSNGVLSNEVKLPNISVVENNLRLGGSENRYFHGTLDDVMIWNRALSESEVRYLYKMQGGKQSSGTVDAIRPLPTKPRQKLEIHRLQGPRRL